MNGQAGPDWDQRYDRADYFYGEEPNGFLASQGHRLKPGLSALALADGEGRNGTWLASQGLDVLSIDGSRVAQDKARRLAERKGVSMRYALADLTRWDFPEAAFDVVAGIFIQFAGPPVRDQLFANIRRTLKPGGMLILTGYRPEQIAYGTGGPRVLENLYTEALLHSHFGDYEQLELNVVDKELQEGSGHHGMSAVIELVARKPA